MNLLTYRIKILLVVILGGVFSQYSFANISVTSKIDSSTLLMGKQTIIHLEVVKDIKQKGSLINEPQLDDLNANIVEGIEYIGLVRNDSTKLSANRIQINKDYLIQSFDSGLYTIPPFLYAIGVDTFESEPLTIKVLPVLLDTVYDKINDYSPIEEISLKWWDYIPDVITDNWDWILIALIALIIITTILVIYLCKIKNKSGTTFKNKVPPHELAINKLIELNSLKLCENGCEKEYYTKISEIIREYLANRFGINALEMTTAQIKYAVKQSEGASISKKYIEIVLEMADFVKFAKVRPLPEDNMRTYQAALQYVHDTKSVEIDENNKNAE